MNLITVKKEIEKCESYEFNGGVGENAIKEALTTTNLQFPPEYIEFLKNLGAGYVSSEEFIGLGGLDHLNVINIFLHLREPSNISRLPAHFVPIRSDGYGNYDCIDTNKATKNGEFMIVAWLHDGGENQDCEELAATYWDWFISILEMIKGLEAEEQ